MRQPIVKDLRSKTKAKDLTSKVMDFIKCSRGQGHGLEDFITGMCTGDNRQNYAPTTRDEQV